ncbi:MAG: aminoacetone oxidase family FAD-binding enzyme [Chlorobiaceae bacterium]|nr:aminoacetone oxidase family FAD-binding enzyme [Chlorobiaceae bacterium]
MAKLRRRENRDLEDRQGKIVNVQQLTIVGAGASGMMAAISARQSARALGVTDDRFRILLIERNPEPGAKIAISGGGHCNLTHDGPVERLIQKGFLRKNEQRFVKPAIYAFDNRELCSLFERYGVPSTARDDGRVFPVSGIARDVVDAMRQMLRDASADLVSGTRVEALEMVSDRFALRAGDRFFDADAVVLAAGGSAWGASGTTGDGFRLAAALGHRIESVLPALAPVFFTVPPDPGIVGVTLRGVGLVVESQRGRDVSVGDLLMSHRGISGPACLSLSRSVAGVMAEGGDAPLLFADFFPGHEPAEVSSFVLAHISRHGSQFVRTFLQRCPMAPERLEPYDASRAPHQETIPNAFVPELMARAGIGHDQTLSVLTRQQRNALVAVLKRFVLGKARKVPLDRAEVTAGGVCLAEVDPKTMRSRLHRRLFCCGELLDYAGEVGGFNLQAAFSTGWMAGAHAARELFG